MSPKAKVGNVRQGQRRLAISQFNGLASEVSVQTVPVKAASQQVEKLVRELDRKCCSFVLSTRLREAITTYLANGGSLPAKLLPPCDSGTPTVPVLQRHRVLDEGFRLCSKAFMLTFNSRAFSTSTWVSFLP